MIAEDALRHICDRASLFALLESLGWRVSAEDTFTYAYDGPALAESVAARAVVSQIPPFGVSDPFALLLVEFETAFRRGDLRDILKAVRANVKQRAAYGGKALDDIVFVCATENYGGVRFVHFEAQDGGRQPKMRVFGWDCDQPDGMRTLRDVNLKCLELPTNVLGEPDWRTAEAQWRQAWDVERVTRAFYTDYERVFLRVEAQVMGVQGDRRLWVQRLMNRLLFIQFLSKKRPAWLRFEGREDYLPAMFERAMRQGENFYHDRLYWAFFYGLGAANDNRAVQRMEQLRDKRGEVPFLNGGLFEMTDLNDAGGSGVSVPNEAFQDILALFAQYNFTITESAPDDADVAIDPEMLGKVFERLVTGRHESGSYYTPRGIVSFMCRESLKQYLKQALTPGPSPNFGRGGNNEAEDAIEAFVERRDAGGLRHPEAALGALRHITVCDPACGSGAYLLGMMQELLALRQALFASRVQDFKDVYDRKREIIQQNIYGADKDPFAVGIAMLRLWLSLTIEDRRNPHDLTVPAPMRDVSLPNLKFKIVVGDSLTAPDPSRLNLMNDEYWRDAAELRSCHERYFVAHDGGESVVGHKAAIEAEVKKAEASLIDLFGSEAKPTNEDGTPRVVWHVAFAEVFAPRHAHADLGGRFNLGGTLAEPPQPGGFDIVLANPPYIRMELFKEAKPVLRRVYAHIHAERADLYTYFYARAVQLLKPGGVLSFISPNKWFRAGYGANLRHYVAETCCIISITDFGDLPVFERATAYPMIFIAQKGVRTGAPTFTQVRSLEDPYPDVLALVKRDGHALPSDAICGRNWVLTGTTQADRLRKMEKSGIPLGEYVGGQIYRGIVTGLNIAFVISEQQRNSLVSANPAAETIIKRLVVGEDVRRWSINNQHQWLIYIKHGADMSGLDAILNYLSPFRNRLESRATKQEWYELQQPQANFAPYFEKPKIIYPEVAITTRFALDTTSIYPMKTCFIINSDDKYLLGVLNSNAFLAYQKEKQNTVRGGYLMNSTIYVAATPIPDASPDERKEIAALVQMCLDAKGVGCAAWEDAIDARVAALYGL